MTENNGILGGKVVVITGAARGLGQAYAVAFTAMGAAVVATDIGNCDETVALASVDGGRCIGVEADVTAGGYLELELTSGGWLTLETEWLDYDGVPRTLADLDVEGADIVNETELVLNIGAGMKWVAPVNEDGVLEILLIAGMIDASSEFEVMQRNLTMEYSGGQGVTIRAGQESPPTVLSHVRLANHEIAVTTLNLSLIHI